MIDLHSTIQFVLISYLVLNVLGFLLLNNNIVLLWRKQDYQFPFDATLFMDKKIGAYWKACNPNPNGQTVVFLHGWSENSSQMTLRANIYWRLGFTLYFLDGPGHGRSGWHFFPTGVLYSERLHQLIQKEKIENPIVHGLSYGSIAAVILALRHPDLIQALVLESAPIHLNGIYSDFLRFAGIPPLLFLPTIIFSELVFRLRYLGEFPKNYDLTKLQPKTFIIHGEMDTMFTLDRHFNNLIRQIHERNDDICPLEFWIADSKGHADIVSHPKFKQKMELFLTQINSY